MKRTYDMATGQLIESSRIELGATASDISMNQLHNEWVELRLQEVSTEPELKVSGMPHDLAAGDLSRFLSSMK